MSNSVKSVRWDVIIYGVIMVPCAAVFYETLGLPPGTFEPLGSGFMPRVISGLVVVLSVLMIIQALRKPAPSAEDLPEPDRMAGFQLVATTLILAALFHSRMVDFGVLVSVFLFVSIMALERCNKKALRPALITSLIIGFGFKYIFTEIFVVDLPVWF